MAKILVPFPDVIRAGVWKYLTSLDGPAVYGCAQATYGGADLDGGFDLQGDAAMACSDGGGGGLCEPTELVLSRILSIPDATPIYFKINDGAIESFTPSISYPASAGDYLNALFGFSGAASLSAITVGGGGGNALFRFFRYSGPSGSRIVGGDGLGLGLGLGLGSPEATPTTIYFLTAADAGQAGDDFVSLVWGQSESVHACAVTEWQGE